LKSFNLEPEPADPQPLKGKTLAADQAKTKALRTAPEPIIEVRARGFTCSPRPLELSKDVFLVHDPVAVVAPYP
jgi:hypothetical protein